MSAVALIAQYLTIVPLLIQAGMSIEQIAQQIYTAITQQGGPTAADWDALHAHEAQARAVLDKRAADAQAQVGG